MSVRKPTVGIEPAVLTSSSVYSLDDLFSEVILISRVACFDVMLLRDSDVVELDKAKILKPELVPSAAGVDNRAFTRIMACSPPDRIAEWIIGKCAPFRNREGFRISALATYYPEIASLSPKRRELAVEAVANTVRIAFKLQDAGLMTEPVVEIVCGQLLDTCDCKECRNKVFVSSPEEKYEHLLDSCAKVAWQFEGKRFALGLELEPGENYVLRDRSSLKAIMDRVLADSVLTAHVGLNVDIAHMKIAGVQLADLEPYLGRIVHAHVADHPGVHTRDQHVGRYTPVQQVREGGYRPYFDLLQKRSLLKEQGLPFSGAVALELEGCNRIEWIYDSLSAMTHLIAASAPESTASTV
jgi:sugar phosphate isomerase/epimerase